MHPRSHLQLRECHPRLPYQRNVVGHGEGPCQERIGRDAEVALTHDHLARCPTDLWFALAGRARNSSVLSVRDQCRSSQKRFTIRAYRQRGPLTTSPPDKIMKSFWLRAAPIAAWDPILARYPPDLDHLLPVFGARVDSRASPGTSGRGRRALDLCRGPGGQWKRSRRRPHSPGWPSGNRAPARCFPVTISLPREEARNRGNTHEHRFKRSSPKRPPPHLLNW